MFRRSLKKPHASTDLLLQKHTVNCKCVAMGIQIDFVFRSELLSNQAKRDQLFNQMPSSVLNPLAAVILLCSTVCCHSVLVKEYKGAGGCIQTDSRVKILNQDYVKPGSQKAQ